MVDAGEVTTRSSAGDICQGYTRYCVESSMGHPVSTNHLSTIIVCGCGFLFVLGFFVCLFFVFLGPHPQHMEVPRLGVKSES